MLIKLLKIKWNYYDETKIWNKIIMTKYDLCSHLLAAIWFINQPNLAALFCSSALGYINLCQRWDWVSFSAFPDAMWKISRQEIST